MNILIVGCSRVGASLASEMSERGYDVSVMGRKSDSLERLDDKFSGLTFTGVPIDNDDLIKAGIESCDAVCAVTDDDNVNLMVAQIAKNVHNVRLVLTQILDPEKAEAYEQDGINPICSTGLTLDAFISALEGYNEEQILEFGSHRVKFYSMPIPKEFIGMKAMEIQYETDEVLYAIINEGGKFNLIEHYNVLLKEGDTLIFSKLVD